MDGTKAAVSASDDSLPLILLGKLEKLEKSWTKIEQDDDLFPKSLSMAKVVNSDGAVTFVFKSDRTSDVFQYLADRKPGLKKMTTAQKKGVNEIRSLGKVPLRLIPGWNWQNSSFPPASSTTSLCCSKVDLHQNHQNKTPRETLDPGCHYLERHCCGIHAIV